MSALISIVCNITQNAYGLGLNKTKDQETLTWLLNKVMFMYGEVDAKVCVMFDIV